MKPPCPYFGICGGCLLQNIDYEEQLDLKQKMVADSFKKFSLPTEAVYPVIGMKDPWFYRNKIQFPIRMQNHRLQMGYFKKGTHEVVNIEECYTQSPYLTEAARIALEVFEIEGLSAYDEKKHQGILRHFIGRMGYGTGEIMLGIVVNSKGLPAAYRVADSIKKRERKLFRQLKAHKDYPLSDKKVRIVSIMQNINMSQGNTILGHDSLSLLGPPFFIEQLDKYKFKIRLTSFFQINSLRALRLYNLIKKLANLSGKELVVDAYAGVGPIAIWLADKAAEVIAIEEVNSAVKDGKENVIINEVQNVKFEQGQAERVLKNYKKADLVVLDPPRGGLNTNTLSRVIKNSPPSIIYVSCNPETLARDLAALVKADYKIETAHPLDMFPHTEHIETVVKLKKSV